MDEAGFFEDAVLADSAVAGAAEGCAVFGDGDGAGLVALVEET